MINKILSLLMGLLFSTAVSSDTRTFSLLTMINPAAPYQLDDRVEWRRYLHLPDGHLVATTDSEWKPKLEFCLNKAWSSPDNLVRQAYLDRRRLKYEGRTFGIDKDEVFIRVIRLPFPEGVKQSEVSGYMVENHSRIVYQNIARDEQFKRCVRQQTGASLTAISIPFDLSTGEQLEYQLDTKEYQPASISIDNIYIAELHQQGTKSLPASSTLAKEAKRHCKTLAFEGLTFSDENERDIAFLKTFYYRSFQHYAFKQTSAKNIFNLSEEEIRERYTGEFLDSQPRLMRLAHTAIRRYDHCLDHHYNLSPVPKLFFVDLEHRSLLALDLKQHRFFKVRDLPASGDVMQ